MGRGVSFGGGQSSLGYLFGGGEAPPPKPVNNETEAPKSEAPKREAPKSEQVASPVASTKQTTDSPGASVGGIGDIPAGVQSHKNNYLRPEGQNCGNFITDRPSTKVHAEPGGGSSLGYLFGGPKN